MGRVAYAFAVCYIELPVDGLREGYYNNEKLRCLLENEQKSVIFTVRLLYTCLS